MENEDPERKVHAWRKEIKIDAKRDAQCEKLIDLENQFECTWDDHFDSTSGAKYRSELISGETKSVDSAPYRAGPRACDFEKTEIDKMLKMGLFEPAKWNGLPLRY